MEFLYLAALIPALAIVFAPRSWLPPIAVVTILLFLYCAYWTWSFSNTCSSDGCIGIFFLAFLTIILGGTAVGAGVARWQINKRHDRKTSRPE